MTVHSSKGQLIHGFEKNKKIIIKERFKLPILFEFDLIPFNK